VRDRDHPIVQHPWTYEIESFFYHRDRSDQKSSYIDLVLRKGSEVRRLRFVGPQDLRIESGFPEPTHGMCILDVSGRQLDGIGVQVSDFEAGGGGLRFYAREVIDLDAGRDRRHQSGRGSLPLIALLLVVPVVIGVAVAVFVRLVPRTSCANEVVAEQPADGAAHRAIVFQRSCGASAPVTTNVSVVSAAEPLPDDVGNVLILKDAHEVTVRWRDPTHLVISYPREVGVALEAGAVHGIEATLEPR